jgi:hypothetical protein
MVNRDAVVRDATQAEPFMAGVMAALLPFALVIRALADTGDYRVPAVAVAVWLGVLAAAAWLVPRARGSGLTAPLAAGALAIALAAVILVEWDRRGPAGSAAADWPILGVVWLLALIGLSRPAWMWVLSALLVFAAHAVFVIRLLGLGPSSLTLVTGAGYLIVVTVAVFAGLRPLLRTQASMAARRAELASESAAERAAVSAIREDRRERLELLEEEALPLLRGIADGTLDPADDDVRERCFRHAAALRHSLTGRGRDAGGMLPGLEPVLRAAAGHGVLVDVQVIGDPARPVPEVAGAVYAAVGGVLRALPPGPVTLTLLQADGDVELYLVFRGPAEATPDVAGLARAAGGAALWGATVDVDETGTGCLAISWRNSPPAEAEADVTGCPEGGFR